MVLPGVVAAGLAVAALLLAGTAAALLVAALLIAIPEHYRYRARRRSAAPVEDRAAEEARSEESAAFAGSWLVPAMETACPTGQTALYEDHHQEPRDAGTADQPT